MFDTECVAGLPQPLADPALLKRAMAPAHVRVKSISTWGSIGTGHRKATGHGQGVELVCRFVFVLLQSLTAIITHTRHSAIMHGDYGTDSKTLI